MPSLAQAPAPRPSALLGEREKEEEKGTAGWDSACIIHTLLVQEYRRSFQT